MCVGRGVMFASVGMRRWEIAPMLLHHHRWRGVCAASAPLTCPPPAFAACSQDPLAGRPPRRVWQGCVTRAGMRLLLVLRCECGGWDGRACCTAAAIAPMPCAAQQPGRRQPCGSACWLVPAWLLRRACHGGLGAWCGPVAAVVAVCSTPTQPQPGASAFSACTCAARAGRSAAAVLVPGTDWRCRRCMASSRCPLCPAAQSLRAWML